MKQYVKALCEAVYPEGNSTPHIEPMSWDAARLILRLRATIEAKDKAFDEMTDKFVEKLEAKDAEIERLDRLLLNEAANTGETEARVKELEEKLLDDAMGRPLTEHESIVVQLTCDVSDRDSRIAALERELAAITHVAMTADPAGWWIAPRGSSDPDEWICVEEMLADLQCPECGYDSMEQQWVCEHCGHRDAIDGAREE